jgi:hypothetical protein
MKLITNKLESAGLYLSDIDVDDGETYWTIIHYIAMRSDRIDLRQCLDYDQHSQ